jgi:23S rRNA pseudouridine1911/1915/1917 synthase
MEKAYKLLSIQENISNKKAKELIDSGLVTSMGRKVSIARAQMKDDTRFKILEVRDIKIIFQDDDILAIDKPTKMSSATLEKKFPEHSLLNRLDFETSGVIMFAKNEAFRGKAISEFVNNKVYKEYVAIVNGKVIDDIVIKKPIQTIKGKKAFSKISKKGKPALSRVSPLLLQGNKSKVKVVIETGRTHQIRVHLSSEGYPILGDETYGVKLNSVTRMLLHSKVTKILGYTFEAKEPEEFERFFN